MLWSPRALRVGLVASFAIPALIIFVASALQAQPRPPIGQPPRPPIMQPPPPIMQPPRPPIIQPPRPPIMQPPPVFQPPKIEQVWSCGKCRREIGTGTHPPGNCPFCGVRIINGHGAANPPQDFVVPPPVINVPQPAPNVTEPDAQEQVARPERSSKGLIIGLVVGGLLFVVMGVLVLGGGVYLLAMRKR